jgi:hypothetical protein
MAREETYEVGRKTLKAKALDASLVETQDAPNPPLTYFGTASDIEMIKMSKVRRKTS